jgi:hypothetical protein
VNARLERAADSTPGLVATLVVGVLLAPLEWRWTKTRALVFAAVCWAAAVVLVVTW